MREFPKRVRIVERRGITPGRISIDPLTVLVYDADSGDLRADVQSFSACLSIADKNMQGSFVYLDFDTDIASSPQRIAVAEIVEISINTA